MTLQKELSDFFSLISSRKEITKSAFCQARLKLKSSAFIYLNNTFLKEFYNRKRIKLWKGFRVLGVDGSTLQLPSSKELMKSFGSMKSSIMPIAKISSCFDVLNEIAIDAQICPYENSEYTIALKHLNKANRNDIIIYDRGYAAVWFMYIQFLKNLNFIIRMQEYSFKAVRLFIESSEVSKIITIMELPWKSKNKLKEENLKFKPFKIRLVKVFLANGEVEILATSLLNERKYLTLEFKYLYFLRWGIETNYGHLKNNMQLENFTGLSLLSVEQDFFANIFINNIQTLILIPSVEEFNNERKRKNRYKGNRNLSLGYLKNNIVLIFLKKNINNLLDKLRNLFKKELIPIREGRTFLRERKSPERKYCMNQKRAI